MPAQQRAVTSQGYPEIKPRDISKEALPGCPFPLLQTKGNLCPAVFPAGCGPVLAPARGWWEGALCPASCTPVTLLCGFTALLRDLGVSGIRGFISCWKLCQEFQEKSVVWGAAG